MFFPHALLLHTPLAFLVVVVWPVKAEGGQGRGLPHQGGGAGLAAAVTLHLHCLHV